MVKVYLHRCSRSFLGECGQKQHTRKSTMEKKTHFSHMQRFCPSSFIQSHTMKYRFKVQKIWGQILLLFLYWCWLIQTGVLYAVIVATTCMWCFSTSVWMRLYFCSAEKESKCYRWVLLLLLSLLLMLWCRESVSRLVWPLGQWTR